MLNAPPSYCSGSNDIFAHALHSTHEAVKEGIIRPETEGRVDKCECVAQTAVCRGRATHSILFGEENESARSGRARRADVRAAFPLSSFPSLPGSDRGHCEPLLYYMEARRRQDLEVCLLYGLTIGRRFHFMDAISCTSVSLNTIFSTHFHSGTKFLPRCPDWLWAIPAFCLYSCGPWRRLCHARLCSLQRS